MSVKEKIFRVVGGTWRFLRRLPMNLVWRWPRASVRGVWRGIRACARGITRAARWSWSTTRYYAALFLYTSRRFLRIEGYIALAAVTVCFSLFFLSPAAKGGRDILNQYYLILTVGMILMAMNLLPRERDDQTLEILWSQPFSRGGMVLVQLLSLTVWCAALMGLMSVLFGRFLSGSGFALWVGIFALTTFFSVGLITVLISTFCRNAIATGIVATLVFGVHYYWLNNLGPINLYFNPIPGAMSSPGLAIASGVPWIVSLINRVFVFCLLGFVYDYLLRRLRHSSPWFT